MEATEFSSWTVPAMERTTGMLFVRRLSQRLASMLNSTRGRSRGADGRRSEWLPLEFFTHPAFGTVPLADVGGRVPLLESQLPEWFRQLPEDDSDRLYDEWLNRLGVALDSFGAVRIEVALYSFDRGKAQVAGLAEDPRSGYSAPWSRDVWDAICKINPEAMRVSSSSRVIMTMFGTYDGVTLASGIVP